MENDYISREAALEAAMTYCPDDDGSCSKAGEDIRDLLDELESIPPADVRPVARGRWVKKNDNPLDGEYCCSNCKEEIDIADGEETPLNRGMNYCPNCGADMRGDKNGSKYY